MKKIYIEAELEVINLLGADIITSSAGGNGPVITPEGDTDVDMGGW